MAIFAIPFRSPNHNRDVSICVWNPSFFMLPTEAITAPRVLAFAISSSLCIWAEKITSFCTIIGSRTCLKSANLLLASKGSKRHSVSGILRIVAPDSIATIQLLQRKSKSGVVNHPSGLNCILSNHWFFAYVIFFLIASSVFSLRACSESPLIR